MRDSVKQQEGTRKAGEVKEKSVLVFGTNVGPKSWEKEGKYEKSGSIQVITYDIQ